MSMCACSWPDPPGEAERRALTAAQEEITRLNAEGDRLALEADRLRRTLAAKDRAQEGTAKIAGKAVQERDRLLDQVEEQGQRIEALEAELDRRPAKRYRAT